VAGHAGTGDDADLRENRHAIRRVPAAMIQEASGVPLIARAEKLGAMTLDLFRLRKMFLRMR
jgi:hypothetical protein